MLTTPDMWRGFAVAYLSALDAVAREEAAGEGKGSRRSWGLSDADYTRKERAGTLAVWHAMVAGHLAGTDDAGLPSPVRRGTACRSRAAPWPRGDGSQTTMSGCFPRIWRARWPRP